MLSVLVSQGFCAMQQVASNTCVGMIQFSSVHFVHVCMACHSLCRAAKAKLQRLERQTKEMEKQVEAYRHSQAKVTELEKTNKKLYDQTHTRRKEIIRLKEEMQSYKTRVSLDSHAIPLFM